MLLYEGHNSRPAGHATSARPASKESITARLVSSSRMRLLSGEASGGGHLGCLSSVFTQTVKDAPKTRLCQEIVVCEYYYLLSRQNRHLV
ncbi:hypothetical protein RRG08_001646 [Elysia crispata]|uniref:Uncharacterized protein n=1 Tax=Elysia crispata TaxID=231223 RepID=A0AAE1DZZ3_9GAST|nr:hypothetical protein RRG08_001646 [Elysia crispata]